MKKVIYLVLTTFISFCLLPGTPANLAEAQPAVELQGPPPTPTPPPPPPLHPKTPPKILHKVEPSYPADAKSKGIEGAVVLHVVVDKAGQPEAVRVMRGNPLLAQAALDAVRQWRWEPVVVGGKTVTVGTKVTVNFKLNRTEGKIE